MTKVKFCGLTRPEDIAAANKLLPDYIGFVMAPASRRYVAPDQARALKRELRQGIKAVGVFVNEDIRRIAELTADDTLDLVQLHGQEDATYIESLRKVTRKPILQAFLIATEKDIAAAQKSSADFILLDAGSGAGKAFDWSLATKMQRPYFLAGGLTPDNVAKAIHQCHPYAVDVSSGIETDGTKDPEKMKVFLQAVKEAKNQE